jgi:hypothetical protein
MEGWMEAGRVKERGRAGQREGERINRRPSHPPTHTHTPSTALETPPLPLLVALHQAVLLSQHAYYSNIRMTYADVC